MATAKQIIKLSDKSNDCSIKNCKPDDVEIAENYKLSLGYKECISNAFKTKKTGKSMKSCESKKLIKNLDEYKKCADAKCSNERTEFKKQLNAILDKSASLQIKYNSCGEAKCPELSKQFSDIKEKCNKYKLFTPKRNCMQKHNSDNIKDKLSKCKKKECKKEHKELNKLEKQIDSIFKHIDKVTNKMDKENEKIYNKYYGSKTKKQLTPKKTLKTSSAKKTTKKTLKRKH